MALLQATQGRPREQAMQGWPIMQAGLDKACGTELLGSSGKAMDPLEGISEGGDCQAGRYQIALARAKASHIEEEMSILIPFCRK